MLHCQESHVIFESIIYISKNVNESNLFTKCDILNWYRKAAKTMDWELQKLSCLFDPDYLNLSQIDIKYKGTMYYY